MSEGAEPGKEGRVVSRDERLFHLFRMLSILWIFPSLGGFLILGRTLPLPGGAGGGWFTRLNEIPFEAFLGGMLVAVHAIFIYNTWKRRKMTFH